MKMGAIATPQDDLPDWFLDFLSRYAAEDQPSIPQVHSEMREELGQAAPELWMINRELRAFERSMAGGAQ